MKFVPILVLALGLVCARMDFHSQYVSKFKPVTSIDPEPVSAAACEPFKCSSTSLNANQCVYPLNGTNNLQICPQGSFCPWALNTKYNTTCVQGSTVISYGGLPGDQCYSNADCGGLSTCNLATNICVGRTTGQSCNDQGDCDVGYVCHNVLMSATCQPMNTLGTKCGDYLSMNLCQNNLACNNGVCTSLFSQGNGNVVSLDSAALLCKSGFYVPGKQPFTAECKSAPPSPSVSLPIACSAGSLCYSKDKTYSTPCQCGFNSNGQGYCPLFPGDAIYQNFFQAFQAYMTSPGVNSCHYLDVLMPTCPGIPDAQYENLESLRLEVEYFTAKMGNDRCVKNIITNTYWYG